MKRSIPGYCTLCRSRCGTLNQIDGDRLVAVDADRRHPTGQATCAKGRAAPELVHSRERILYPLMRTRPKGDADPGWQRIGWREALDRVAERLGDQRDRYGAESVAFSVTTPGGTPMSDSIDWVEGFIRRFGSPNTIYATELCNWHKDVAHTFTFGCATPTPDYTHARLNILWGHNPSSVWLAQAGRLADTRHNDHRKLLVIDPRATAHARAADLWLRIRPGSDGALALGLARLLIERDGVDWDFIQRWTNALLLVEQRTGRFLSAAELDGAQAGFLVWSTRLNRAVAVDTQRETTSACVPEAALSGTYRITLRNGQRVVGRPAFDHYRSACDEWSLERTAAATDLAPAAIERAAELLEAAGQRVSYYGWTGIGQHANATQTERAIATLYALTGAFDRVGGNRIYGPLPARCVNDLSLLDPAQRAKALGQVKRPLGPAASGWVTASDVYDAILDQHPYPVRTLVGFGGNFLVSQPDPRRGEQALCALEFHVHCDLFHTPTNAFADILLPINTPWEREGLRIGFDVDAQAAARVQLRPRMIAPRGASRADYDIVMELAGRLGMAAEFFDGDIHAGWDYMLEPLGLDIETLRAAPRGCQVPIDDGQRKYARRADDGRLRGFDTPTRRVELYSQYLHDKGYPAVPQAYPAAPTDLSRPLRLVTVKNGYFCHSQHRQLSSLRRRAADPRVTVAPAVARRRNMVAGQWVELDGSAGRVRLRLAIDMSLGDEIAIADYGAWQACHDLGLPGTPIHGPGSQNSNAAIAADERDPISGAIALRSTVCELRAVSDDIAWSGFRELRVSRIERHTPAVVSVYLRAVDDTPLAAFHPGQHLLVQCVLPDGRELERCYSLSGAASAAPREYRISVKRLDESGEAIAGTVSHHFNAVLAPGDPVRARMPAGRFTLPQRHTAPVVLIAGGIGITPFLSLLETFAAEDNIGGETMPETWLIYANRTAATHVFRERIAAIARRLPRLRVIDVYSAPGPTERLGRDYDYAGRVDDRLIDADWIARGARFYLCGPAAMMRDLWARLAARGVMPFEIFTEAFTAPEPVRSAALQARDVFLKRSGRRIRWSPAYASILACAQAHGVDLPSGCRSGECESCTLRLLSGQVHTAVEVPLADVDTCLTCQSVPLTDVELDA